MEPLPRRVELTVSWETLLRFFLFAVAVSAAYVLRATVLLFVIVFLFVAAVHPTINALQTRMSRAAAVLTFFGLLAIASLLTVSLLVPALVRQVLELVAFLPALLAKIEPYLGAATYQRVLEQVYGLAGSFSGNLVSGTTAFFGTLAEIVTGVILSLYLLLEEKNARQFFFQILPRDRFEPVYTTLRKISIKMGAWIRGQLIAMATVGVLMLVVYLIAGVPGPLPLALFAGLAEVVPYVGPPAGVLPALAVVLVSGSGVSLIVVLIGFMIVQQLESHVIVPKVMGRAIGLSPVLVITALIIGTELLGLLGAFISIPLAAIVSVVVEEWPNLRLLWQPPVTEG